MNTCKTCSKWTPIDKETNYMGVDYARGGICESNKITESWGKYDADSLVYSYDEGGSFWTGPDFGCVHHEAK